jgi:hypothetical protein
MNKNKDGPAETLFPPLGTETRKILDALPGLIDRVFPLSGRFMAVLPRDVAELSRLLTSDRSERSGGYLGKPTLLSAYLRYFLPWNVYRLARLLPALPISLVHGDTVIDLGAGPLTLPLALWISRPDLRPLRLEFRCLDRTPAALEAGRRLFHALAGDGPWIIKTFKGSIGGRGKGGSRIFPETGGKGAALVTAVNVFDELFRHVPQGDLLALGREAGKQARMLTALTPDTGSILVVEPGIPRSGEFISLLRAALLEYRRIPRAPCPHAGPCPFPGVLPEREPLARGRRPFRGKGKWCHFAFDTKDAPPSLLRLSAAAGLPKERATLSFLLAGGNNTPADESGRSGGNNTHTDDRRHTGKNNTHTGESLPAESNTHVDDRKAGDYTSGACLGEAVLPVRIISDAFPLPAEQGDRSGRSGKRSGRYACSVKGPVLAAGKRQDLEERNSGTLLYLVPPDQERRDPKSGALVVKI